MTFRRPLVALTAFVLLIAACSSDGDGDTTPATGNTTAPSTGDSAGPATDAPTTSAAATTTTLDPAAAATAYSEPGPYPAGVTTLELASGQKVEVWYPAVEGSDGTETYDVRDLGPAALAALLPPGLTIDFSYAATRDAAVADGSFPLVAFSHGAIGFRLQSTALTSHLATWGMIVASTDHPSRDLAHLLDFMQGGQRPADTSADELAAVIDLMIEQGATAGSPFEGHVDGDHVATLGHSAGGATALRVAVTDDRVDGYVSMASGIFRGGDGTDASTTTTAPTLPGKPSFFIAGAADGVADVETVTRPAFELAPSPSLLWVIEGAGHLAFSDLCLLADGQGIIGVAEANGLADFLASAPGVKRLGSDGCNPPALPVTETMPIIDHAVTAWLRALFGLDPAPVGLDESVADQYPTAVSISVK